MLALRCRSITSAALKPAGQVATLAAAPSRAYHALGSSSPARFQPLRTARIQQRTQGGMAAIAGGSIGGAGVLHIERVPCLSDNYSWLLHEPRRGVTAVVDPAEAAPVAAALQRHGWQLTHILNSELLLPKQKSGPRSTSQLRVEESCPALLGKRRDSIDTSLVAGLSCLPCCPFPLQPTTTGITWAATPSCRSSTAAPWSAPPQTATASQAFRWSWRTVTGACGCGRQRPALAGCVVHRTLFRSFVGFR